MIYFIRDRTARAIKIGVADDPRKRLATLQIGNPNPLTLMGIIAGHLKEEAELHEKFKPHHIRGEWFQDDPQMLTEVLALIEQGERPWFNEPLRKEPVPTYAEIPLDHLWLDAQQAVEAGDEVWHPVYGDGSVVAVQHEGSDYKVSAWYDKIGAARTFLALKSPLWLVNRKMPAKPAEPRKLVRTPATLPDWARPSTS